MNRKQQKIVDKLIKSKSSDEEDDVENISHGLSPTWDAFYEEARKRYPKFTQRDKYLMKKIIDDMNGNLSKGIDEFNKWYRKHETRIEKGDNNHYYFAETIKKQLISNKDFRWSNRGREFYQVKHKPEPPKEEAPKIEEDKKEEEEKQEDSVSLSEDNDDKNNNSDPPKPTSFTDVVYSLEHIDDDKDPETQIKILINNDSYLKNNNINDAKYDDVLKKNSDLLESKIKSMGSSFEEKLKKYSKKFMDSEIGTSTFVDTLIPSPSPYLPPNDKEDNLKIEDLKVDKPAENKEPENNVESTDARISAPVESEKKRFTQVKQVNSFIKAGQGNDTDEEYLEGLHDALSFCENWRQNYRKGKTNKENENRIRRIQKRIAETERKINKPLQSELSVSKVEDPKELPDYKKKAIKSVEEAERDLNSEIILKLSYWNNPEILADSVEEVKGKNGHTIVVDTLMKRRINLIKPAITRAMTRLKSLLMLGYLTSEEFQHEKQKIVDKLNADFFGKDNEYGIKLATGNMNSTSVKFYDSEGKKLELRAEKGYVNQNAPNKDTFFQYNMGDIYDIIEEYISDDDKFKFKLSEHAKGQIESIVNSSIEQYKKKADAAGMVSHNVVRHGKTEEHMIKLIEKYINSRKNIHIKAKFEFPTDARTKIIEIVQREEERYNNKLEDMKHQDKLKSKNVMAKINSLFFR